MGNRICKLCKDYELAIYQCCDQKKKTLKVKKESKVDSSFDTRTDAQVS